MSLDLLKLSCLCCGVYNVTRNRRNVNCTRMTLCCQSEPITANHAKNSPSSVPLQSINYAFHTGFHQQKVKKKYIEWVESIQVQTYRVFTHSLPRIFWNVTTLCEIGLSCTPVVPTYTFVFLCFTEAVCVRMLQPSLLSSLSFVEVIMNRRWFSLPPHKQAEKTRFACCVSTHVQGYWAQSDKLVVI